jgi:hypothetical protein
VCILRVLVLQAVSAHDKGERATHRAMAHLCSAYDATYIAALEVRGPRSLIIEVLSLVSDANDRSFCLQSFLDGSREGSFLLHSPQQSPFGCIAPVRFLWESRPVQSFQLLHLIFSSSQLLLLYSAI